MIPSRPLDQLFLTLPFMGMVREDLSFPSLCSCRLARPCTCTKLFSFGVMGRPLNDGFVLLAQRLPSSAESECGVGTLRIRGQMRAARDVDTVRKLRQLLVSRSLNCSSREPASRQKRTPRASSADTCTRSPTADVHHSLFRRLIRF